MLSQNLGILFYKKMEEKVLFLDLHKNEICVQVTMRMMAPTPKTEYTPEGNIQEKFRFWHFVFKLCYFRRQEASNNHGHNWFLRNQTRNICVLKLWNLIFLWHLVVSFDKILMVHLRNSSLLEIQAAAQPVVQNSAASSFQISWLAYRCI